MPLLFGALTAFVLILSAFIGMKNHAHYKKQVELREAQEASLASELKLIKKTDDKLLDTIAEIEGFMAKNKVLSEEIATKESDTAKVKSEIAAKEAKKKELSGAETTDEMKKIAEVRALMPEVKKLRSDIVSLKDETEKTNAKLNNLKQAKEDTEASISSNQERIEFETTGKSQPSLNTTIKTVYLAWGFVTLNGGDIQGVVPGSTLAVVRGDEVLAKLKVTTVETNRAAADIIRETLGAGVFLRAGDKVVAIATAEPADEAAPNTPSNNVTAN